MGTSGSKLEKALGESLPESEKFFGLENAANTCYCNSVLQALYFCRPFRKQLLQYAASHSGSREENLLGSLAELFATVRATIISKRVCCHMKFLPPHPTLAAVLCCSAGDVLLTPQAIHALACR